MCSLSGLRFVVDVLHSIENLSASVRILNTGSVAVPAEPEDHVPHGVHDAAAHRAALLLLLLGES